MNQIQLNEQQNALLAHENIDKICTFVQIAQDVYAFDSSCVLEIIKLVELNQPERLPSHILGLLEYNQKIIPIVDIRSVLRLKKEPYGINSMIVIVNLDDNIFGIIVNKVIDIKRVELKDIQPSPYNSENSFIESIYSSDIFQCAILNIPLIGKWVTEHKEIDDCKSSMELLPNDSFSLETLHERKLELLEKSRKNPYLTLGDKDEFVSFEVGQNKYCLKMDEIKGFNKLQNTKMTRVPCTPPFVLGLVNIKGDFITVIDIRSYFHSKEPQCNMLGTIITLNSDEFKVGILADTVGDNIQIKPEEIQNINKQDAKAELSQYVNDGEIYLIINVKEMLANEKLYVH